MTTRTLKRLAALLSLSLALPVGMAMAQEAAPAAPATAQPAFAAGAATPSDLLMKNLMIGATTAGDRLVAVGEFGHVALSDDKGKTWRQAKAVPTQATLTSVTFVDAQHGWAAGHDMTILATTDGGETWTVQYSRDAAEKAGVFLPLRGAPEAAPTEAGGAAAPAEGAAPEAADGAAVAGDQPSDDDVEFVEGGVEGGEFETDVPFLGIAITSPTHGIAVGGFNYAVETTDGGKTWTPRRLVTTAGDDYHLNAVVLAGDGLMIVPSEMGQIYRSVDGGASWTIVQTEYEGSFWGGLPLKDGSVLVMGMRGNIWRSADKGATWTQLGDGLTPESLAAGVQLADGAIALVGIGGVVMISQDNGATWDLSRSQYNRKGLSAVLAGPDDTLLLFGEGGLATVKENAGS